MRSLPQKEQLEIIKKKNEQKLEAKKKVAYNFMQKYYHKGAFYQDSEESDLENQDPGKREVDEEEGDQRLKFKTKNILNRDYNMPTLDDKRDKTLLPSLLQKRQGTFGRKGQSKWTHLTNEDTTNFNPATRVAESVA